MYCFFMFFLFSPGSKKQLLQGNQEDGEAAEAASQGVLDLLGGRGVEFEEVSGLQSCS